MDCTPKVGYQLSKVQFFMAKPKYSLETRLAVVNHYLAGKCYQRCKNWVFRNLGGRKI